MKIQIDAKEQSRIKPALDHYKKHNPTVEDLEIGDYIFNDEVVFEYKTFEDFLDSIVDKRVFNQSMNQREAFPYHFVIIELGKTFHLAKSLQQYYYSSNKEKSVAKKKYYGTISRLNTYTTVLPVCGDKYDCFRVMFNQAEKCLDEKILVKYPEVKTGNTALNFLCNNIRGVGVTTAENITNDLKLETLEDLLSLSYDGLVSVDGIGDKTAVNILNKIRRN